MAPPLDGETTKVLIKDPEASTKTWVVECALDTTIEALVALFLLRIANGSTRILKQPCLLRLNRGDILLTSNSTYSADVRSLLEEENLGSLILQSSWQVIGGHKPETCGRCKSIKKFIEDFSSPDGGSLVNSKSRGTPTVPPPCATTPRATPMSHRSGTAVNDDHSATCENPHFVGNKLEEFPSLRSGNSASALRNSNVAEELGLGRNMPLFVDSTGEMAGDSRTPEKRKVLKKKSTAAGMAQLKSSPSLAILGPLSGGAAPNSFQAMETDMGGVASIGEGAGSSPAFHSVASIIERLFTACVNSSLPDNLDRLIRMRKNGDLTETEFVMAKRKMLM